MFGSIEYTYRDALARILKQDWLTKEAGFWAYMQSSKTSHKPFSAKASLTLPFAVWQFILKCLGQYWKQSVEWNRSQSRDLVLKPKQG